MGRRITIAGIVVVVGLLAGAAVTLGSGTRSSGRGPGVSAPVPTHLSAPAFPVASPQQGAPGRAAASKRVAIRYFETKKTLDIRSGTDYFTFSGKPCPRGSKAISGYSFYAGKTLPPALVATAGGAPQRLRNWQFYLSNPNDDSVNEQIKFGVICAKHVD